MISNSSHAFLMKNGTFIRLVVFFFQPIFPPKEGIRLQ